MKQILSQDPQRTRQIQNSLHVPKGADLFGQHFSDFLHYHSISISNITTCIGKAYTNNYSNSKGNICHFCEVKLTQNGVKVGKNSRQYAIRSRVK